MSALAEAPPRVEAPPRPSTVPDFHLPEPGRTRVYVWELPVRLTHWVIVLAIIVLTVTGLYIADPWLVGSRGDGAYLMAKMRFVHLVAGAVLAVAAAARVAWAFRGNRYARWDQFVPVSWKRLRASWPYVTYYLLLRRHAPDSIGHNPLAGLAYLAVYGLFLVQVVTGIALMALADTHGVWWKMSGWVFFLAPIPVVRLVHHLVMWLVLAFAIHHVFSAILFDLEHRDGTMSSIFSGSKWIRTEG